LLASLENDLIRPSVFNTVLQMLPDTGGIAKCDERFLFMSAAISGLSPGMLSGINPMSAPLLVFTGMLRATTPPQ
jgi:hypothetical protein